MRKSGLLLAAVVLSFFATSANAQIKVQEELISSWPIKIPDCNFEEIVRSLHLRATKLVPNLVSYETFLHDESYGDIGNTYAVVVAAADKWPDRYEINIKNCKIERMSQNASWHISSPGRYTYSDIILYSNDRMEIDGVDKPIDFTLQIDTMFVSKKILDEIFLSGKISLQGNFGVFGQTAYDYNTVTEDQNNFRKVKIIIFPEQNTVHADK